MCMRYLLTTNLYSDQESKVDCSLILSPRIYTKDQSGFVRKCMRTCMQHMHACACSRVSVC